VAATLTPGGASAAGGSNVDGGRSLSGGGSSGAGGRSLSSGGSSGAMYGHGSRINSGVFEILSSFFFSFSLFF